MTTIKIRPSSYTLSNTSNLSCDSNESSMYDSDDSTYATFSNSWASGDQFIYINGFNLSDIPEGAIVNSFTVKIKIRTSRVTSNNIYLTNGTNPTNDYSSTRTTKNSSSAETITIDKISSSWATLASYGSNLGIRINAERSTWLSAGYVYIYDAYIEANYTIPSYLAIKQNNT